MSFNVATIPVSMSGMVYSFNTPPTTVGTAVVMYSLGVSGFVMLGAMVAMRNSRHISRAGFLFVVAGTLWLAFVVHNNWSVFPVILGLFIIGVGQGALVTLLFNGEIPGESQADMRQRAA
jgi:hypothetical protein